MRLRLSPMLTYNIVFWTVSLPLIPIVVFLIIFGLINPFKRRLVMDYIEYIVTVMCNWRNGLSFIEYLHNKAYLFDMLRDSKG